MASITRKATTGYLVRWRDREERRSRSRYFATEQQARLAKARLEAGLPEWWDTTPPPVDDSNETQEAQVLRALLRPSTWFAPTVSDYARKVLAVSELQDSTRRQYVHTLENHVDPTRLGNTPLRKVTPDMVRDFFTGSTAGKGARRNVHKTLARTFNQAVTEGLLDSSPLLRAGVRKPNGDRLQEVRPLTAKQIEALADACLVTRVPSKFAPPHVRSQRVLSPEAARLATLVLGYAGLRVGELSAVRVSDLNSHGIAVNRAADPQGRIKVPKTKAGRRTAPLAPSVLAELRAYCETAGLSGDDLIWPVQSQTVARAVRNAGRSIGLSVHVHQLRHSAASMWIEDGWSPRRVQTALGHANVRVTLDLYSHLFDQDDGGLAQSMEARRQAVKNGRTPINPISSDESSTQ